MANLEQEVGFKTFRALPPIHVLVKRCVFFALSVYLFNNRLALTLNEIGNLKSYDRQKDLRPQLGNELTGSSCTKGRVLTNCANPFSIVIK